MREKYYQWLVSLVANDGYHEKYYDKLFKILFTTEFTWTIRLDVNRAADGVELRQRYRDATGEYCGVENHCSLLEMMVALAVRCEETIMCNDDYGNRTGDWFWGMIVSLGLDREDDGSINEYRVNDILNRFLAHNYDSDGKGSLFYIPGIKEDLRQVEIWYQCMWYLDTLV